MALPSIVVLDDDPTELELLTCCYGTARFSQPLICFDNIEDLRAHLRRAHAGECSMPLIILVDVHLIGADGFELVEQLSVEFGELTRFALMSNARCAEDVERATQLGVQLHAKPSGIKETVQLFQQLTA